MTSVSVVIVKMYIYHFITLVESFSVSPIEFNERIGIITKMKDFFFVPSGQTSWIAYCYAAFGLLSVCPLQ